MASGSSSRANSSSKGFDFASDDILCSYEDFSNQDTANVGHSDPVMASNSSKDFHKSRVTRSSVFPATAYSQPEYAFNQDIISSVDKSMKKYSDNLLRFLEGISSRLSQLELYCYNLDKSIGEMRSELVRDHGEADGKLKSLEKHLQEVHRSVQILRDKQELVDTQKELAKLQLVQKESSSSPSHSQSNEERASPPASDPKLNDNPSETNNQQLALALPQQIPPHQQSIATPFPAPPQNVTQHQSYYVPQTQFSNRPSDPQYRTHQIQDVSRVAPQSTYPQPSQTPPLQQFTQYHQQRPQQLPQQVQLPQQPSLQPQVRPSPLPTSLYPSYPPNHPTNSSTPETLPNSMPMQVPFQSISQPGSSRVDTMPYGYIGSGRIVPPQSQQPPPQQVKGTFGTQAGNGYVSSGPHPSAYLTYENEGGRSYNPPPQQPQFNQSGYPLPNPQPTTGPHLMVRNQSHSQFVRSHHPYGELIDKLMNMGFRNEHIVGVIQRMEESGQPVDYNAVLDRLSGQSSTQRGW